MSTGQDRGRTGRGQRARATDSPPGPGARGSSTIFSGPVDTIPDTVRGQKAPGTAGTEIELFTNFIEWNSKEPKAHAYHVNFVSPLVEMVATRRALVK